MSVLPAASVSCTACFGHLDRIVFNSPGKDQRIPAGTAVNRVMSRTAEEGVVSATAGQMVIPETADQVVVTATAHEHRILRAVGR